MNPILQQWFGTRFFFPFHNPMSSQCSFWKMKNVLSRIVLNPTKDFVFVCRRSYAMRYPISCAGVFAKDLDIGHMSVQVI